MKSIKLLGVRIDDLNKTQVLKQVKTMLNGQSFNHLATVNPEFLVEAAQNKGFKKILNNTALNVCDGFGITFWTKILYNKKIPRLTGVELAEQICKLAAKQQKSVYFLGGFEVSQKSAQVMRVKYPTLVIAGAENGDPTRISQSLREAQPDVLLVAFGAPAQELWIDKFKVDLPSLKLAVGIGGTFDFWASKTTRAPNFIRSVGLEWLWRLITEPKRFKRIWNAVIVFSYQILKERIQGRP